MSTSHKLSQMILDAFDSIGIVAKNCSIRAPQGYWRSSPFADVYRFEGTVLVEDFGIQIVNSWNTMSDCVRNGITIDRDGNNHWLVNTKAKK